MWRCGGGRSTAQLAAQKQLRGERAATRHPPAALSLPGTAVALEGLSEGSVLGHIDKIGLAKLLLVS
jgi:hypothetical protein